MKRGRGIRVAVACVIAASALAMLGGVGFLWPRFVRPSEKTFAAVAKRAYGDEKMWFPLAAVNPGVNKLRPWMVLRIPGRTVLDAWCRDFRKRRGLPADWYPLYERFTAGNSVGAERWLTDVMNSPSPDESCLIFELRGLDVDESKWSMFLNTSSNSAPRQLCGGDSSYKCVWVEWREDSGRFVLKVYTGYDECGGEKPITRWIYVIGDRTPESLDFRTVTVDSNNSLSSKKLEDVMQLPLAQLRRVIQATPVSSPSTSAP
jgi:hypothetical protein